MAGTRRSQAAPASVLAWEDDPGAPEEGLAPVSRPVPRLGARRLPLAIRGVAPAAGVYKAGTKRFRYWTAAEALRRAADFWAGCLPVGVTWYPTNGKQLSVRLDEGEDLNAYYDRQGLHFFHARAGRRVVYSGESPNVSCHELGHAILDALRPQLWDVASIEAAAFHESLGDMSALLAALQLRSFRETVLTETGGRLYRASRLSRLAEQLGWAIRQSRPDLVDRDCLRNAVNALFYRDPGKLPPDGPAGVLSSEPHSFSRVFTAGFFQALAGMHAGEGSGEERLAAVSVDSGALLVAAVERSPIVPGYFSQIAAHMIEADAERFGGKYRNALQSGFVRHGVLSLQSAVAAARGVGAAVGQPGARDVCLPHISLPGARYGLGEDLLVQAASEPARFDVAGAAPSEGGVMPPAHDRAAALFVEDLLRRGKVDLTTADVGTAAIVNALTRKTHELRREAEGLCLARRFFDCGFTQNG